MLLLVVSIPMNVFGATTLAITTQPSNQTVVAGKTVSFSVAATGATSYQWQTYNGSKWVSLSWNGAKTNTLKFTSDEKYSGKQFRCVVGDGTNKIATNTVVFKVLKITTQPTDQFVAVGKKATFSVVDTGAASYQWQTYNGSKWVNLSWTGAKTNTMTFNSDEKYSGKQFRCILSDGTNKIATDTVSFNTLSIKTQPSSQRVIVGETVELSIEAPGASSYQWQTYNGTKWVSLSWTGAKTDKMTFISDHKYSGKIFRCVVKDSAGNSVISEEVSFEVLNFTITYDAGEGLFENNSRFMTNKENPGWVDLGPFYPDGTQTLPNMQGKVFVGWMLNGRLVNKVEVKSDVTVTAKWADECLINYDANGGDFSEETIGFAEGFGYTYANCVLQEKVASGTYFIPQWIEPVREGYSFKGWKLGGAYTRGVSVNSNNAITLKADWEKTVTVTYDANGGQWQFNPDEEPFDKVYIQQPTGVYYLGWHSPEREGYIFYGWKDANERNVVKVNLTGNATFRAIWHPVYNVTYHGNGGEFNAERYHDDWYYAIGDLCFYDGKNYECISDVDCESWDASKWQEIEIRYDVVCEERGGYYHVGSVETPCRDGYEFVGWSALPTAQRGEWGWDIPLQADIEFYAIWAKEDIVITFDANEGYIPWGEGDEYEEFSTKDFEYNPWDGLEIIMADRGERDEYIFLGWSKNSEATEPEYFEHQRVYFSDSTTLYAVWEKRAAIVFDADGGLWIWDEWDDEAGENVEQTAEIRTEYRDDGTFYYVRTWNPEREGYRFDGWLDKDGKLVDDSKYIILEKDKEYYYKANWFKIVKVTYDANGGDFGYDDEEDAPITEEYWEGDSGDVHIGWRWPDREGYTFVGWSTDPDADPVAEEIESDFDVELDEDVIYYAIWSEPFDVTFDANGGIFYYNYADEPVTEEVDYEVEYGEYELRDWFYRDGYEFLGWDENPEATEPMYGSRERITIKCETTFYAIWHKYPIVTYNSGEGQWGDDEYPEYTKLYWSREGEVYYVGMEEPWREGFEFNGWVDENGERVDGMLITLDQDYEFFASWRRWINVRYNANGGQFFEWNDELEESFAIGKVIDRETRTEEDYYLDGWQPERPGYRFVGWAYDANATEEDIIEGPVVFDTEDFETENEIELFAVWRKCIDITYDFNGGEWNNQGSETFWDYDGPSEFDVGFEWPYLEGYEFLGWSDDPDAENAEPNYTCILTELDSYEDYLEANAKVTFYAIWDEKAVVTFNAGDGEFENGENAIIQYFRIGDVIDWDRDFGTEYEINLRPELDGYMFAGWTYYDEDLDMYQEFRYVRVTGDIEVYAKWIKLNTVVLDANGGTVWDEDGNPFGILYLEKNEDCTLPASMFEPVKEGYEFLGWYDENDELVNFISFEEDSTLTAKWSGEEDPNHQNNPWGVTSVEISSDSDTVEAGVPFQIDYYVAGIAESFTWYRSTDQNNWVEISYDMDWIEEILNTPGTYYYMLVADEVGSNILEITVVE